MAQDEETITRLMMAEGSIQDEDREQGQFRLDLVAVTAFVVESVEPTTTLEELLAEQAHRIYQAWKTPHGRIDFADQVAEIARNDYVSQLGATVILRQIEKDLEEVRIANEEIEAPEPSDHLHGWPSKLHPFSDSDTPSPSDTVDGMMEGKIVSLDEYRKNR